MQMRWAKIIFLLFCCCVFSANGAAQSKPTHLLLVCGIDSTIPALSNAEVRKLFLGAPVNRNGLRLKPLRNATDHRLTEVFLQKIIFMSKRKYEAQLVARVFRLGGVRPKVYKDLTELIDTLRHSPETVTYMWSHQFAQADELKSIGVLWEDSHD